MGLLDHMVVLFLISWRISILFSIVAVPVYIPTVYMGYSFSTFSPHPAISCLLDNRYPNRCEVIIVMPSTISCTFGNLYVLFERISIQVLSPSPFFAIKFHEFLVYLEKFFSLIQFCRTTLPGRVFLLADFFLLHFEYIIPFMIPFNLACKVCAENFF